MYPYYRNYRSYRPSRPWQKRAPLTRHSAVKPGTSVQDKSTGNRLYVSIMDNADSDLEDQNVVPGK